MSAWRETLSWLITLFIAVAAGLVIVQLATRLAFVNDSAETFEAAALHRAVADYGPDDNALQFTSLDYDLAAEAFVEDSNLKRANAGRSDINFPTEPSPSNILNLLLAPPAAISTQVIQLPPTSTSLPTQTFPATSTLPPSASATRLDPTRSPTPTPSAAASATFTPIPTTKAANTPASIKTNTPTTPIGPDTVTVEATRTSTRTLTATPTATATRESIAIGALTSLPIPSAGLKINFQPDGVLIPAGYLIDVGESFAQRGDGFVYGWNAPNRHAIDRGLISDQRYDTLNFMQSAGSFTWEAAVPNGLYTVRILAGDACCIDSFYRINVEDIVAIDGQPTNNQRWFESKGLVEVKDGRLTVSNAVGARNNKINFIEIYPGDLITRAQPTATPTTTTPTKTPTPKPTVTSGAASTGAAQTTP